MERLSWIHEAGQDILVLDLSSLSDVQAALEVIKQAEPLIRSQPPHSLLLLSDVTNSHYNNEWVAAIKKFSQENTPYIRASAVVGVTGLGLILIKALQAVSGRAIECQSTRAAAVQWLLAQPRQA